MDAKVVAMVDQQQRVAAARLSIMDTLSKSDERDERFRHKGNRHRDGAGCSDKINLITKGAVSCTLHR